MKFSALALLATAVSADEPCCNTCPNDGKMIKTYSIDPNAGHCGESCIPAS